MNERHKKVLDLVRDKKVLDIGFIGKLEDVGKPHWLHEKIKQKALSVKGIDFNYEGVKLAKKQGYDCEQANIWNYTDQKKYDVVCFLEILEHVADQQILNKLCEFLKPNGEIILTTPNATSLSYQIQVLAKGKLKVDKDHVIMHSACTLKRLAQQCGLKMVSVDFVSSYSGERPVLDRVLRFARRVRPEWNHNLLARLKW